LDALVVLSESFTVAYRARIADFAVQHKRPSIHALREYTEAGGLMNYGPNLADLARRAATYVDKILKGAKPADLPVEQPMLFDFIVNLKTAEVLGLTIPERVLLQVTEVIQ
jgi:putative ABC transport system substrate-binding protein